MSSDSAPRSPGMQSVPGANAAGSPKSGFLASAKASAAPTAQTILTLLKDASSMIQNAPYVGLIASIMLEILKIKDEVTACRDKWAEVMGDIQGIQKIIAEHADSADPTDTVLSDDIKTHLRDLEKVLESVTKALSLLREREVEAPPHSTAAS